MTVQCVELFHVTVSIMTWNFILFKIGFRSRVLWSNFYSWWRNYFANLTHIIFFNVLLTSFSSKRIFRDEFHWWSKYFTLGNSYKLHNESNSVFWFGPCCCALWWWRNSCERSNSWSHSQIQKGYRKGK